MEQVKQKIKLRKLQRRLIKRATKEKRWSDEYEGFDGNNGVTRNIRSKKCIFYKIVHYDQTRRGN